MRASNCLPHQRRDEINHENQTHNTARAIVVVAGAASHTTPSDFKTMDDSSPSPPLHASQLTGSFQIQSRREVSEQRWAGEGVAGTAKDQE